MKDIYQSYDVEALASDPDFIQSVVNSTTDTERIWSEWLHLHPDRRPVVEAARKLVLQLQFQHFEDKAAEARIWNRIEASTKVKPLKVTSHRALSRRFFITAFAAGLAILVFFQFLLNAQTNIETEPGSDLVYQLPDESKVHLNDGSFLRFSERKYPNDRTLTLDGEAFFDVRKGEQFVIQTALGEVSVLGTSFNVFSRDQRFEVRCFTGKIKVSIGGQEVILNPGQVYSTSFADSEPQTFSLADYEDWRKGVFKFESRPLLEVIHELERQFDLSIDLDESISDLHYTGFFMSDDLDKALYNISWPLKLSVKREKNKISISQD